MTIDKRINYRDAGYVSQAYAPRSRSSAPKRTTPNMSGLGRQQYSAVQTQTGAVKGGGPRGPDKKFTTSFVDPQRGRDSRDEFIKSVQKTNPRYTGGPPRNNFLTRGIGFAKSIPLEQFLIGAINPVFGPAMVGASFLNNPEIRKRLTGYETQAEYDEARQNRINLNRIKTLENTIQKKYLDKGRSLTETDLDERLAGLKSQMGITPNTAADLRPDLDFSNQSELAFEGIGSLDNNNDVINTINNLTSNVDKLSNEPNIEELYKRDRDLSLLNTFVPSPAQTGIMSVNPNAGIPFAGTVLEDEFPSNRLPSFIEVQDTPQSKDDFFLNAVADATTFPTDDGSGISLMKRSILRNAGYNDSQIKEAFDKGYGEQLIRDIEGPIGGSLGSSAFG
jgi:hypothetical protein